jgi:hypothetical protein
VASTDAIAMHTLQFSVQINALVAGAAGFCQTAAVAPARAVRNPDVNCFTGARCADLMLDVLCQDCGPASKAVPRSDAPAHLLTLNDNTAGKRAIPRKK